ncbi:DNA-binding protein WhiA [Kineothrix sp. MB12-C1]|uniref:DNA-binding protein WhiA n=1 Tax=Kineothrix sp. MB12-C1 TaxID=3070215 RepID=UPI0027D1FC71|nr:DNA-binding protein WhiA [Kineothrix sp. MB12-C1]WMC94482.1 DNA-binding protein WhiA [Kineothrix sp. MB12-C1]
MSFSSEVKEELAKIINSSRHCQLAELAAIICFYGKVENDGIEEKRLCLQTENEALIRKVFTLLKKTFNIDTDIVQESIAGECRSHTYITLLYGTKAVDKVLQAVKMYDEKGIEEAQMNGVNPLLIKSACCKRAFLRGVFLCTGSMSDPEKSYHLEFVCSHEEQAEYLQALIQSFQVEAKIVIRKKYYVVYLKEGAGIVDLLNVMEAHVSLMNFENYRIIKEMRNSINRKVNCETANITKTVNASSKQIEDILLIKERYGFMNLPDSIREAAEIRLEYPDATLKELGQILDPPVGKSGMNHRLRKLSELADRLRS